MENSKPSTSKDGTNTSHNEHSDKICKGCGKVFAVTKILKHISHTPCQEQYTKEEMKMLRKLADERKKKRDKEHRDKSRETKLEQDKWAITETCKSCNKVFSDTSILKHIPHTESCQKGYSEYDMGLLRFLANERSKDIDFDYYQMNQESIAKNRAKRYNAAHRKQIYEEKKAKRDYLIDTCKSCKKKLWHTSILRHIGQKKPCKDNYALEQIDILRGWAKEKKRLKEIDYKEENREKLLLQQMEYYEKNKEALASKRSYKNKEITKERKKKKHEEMMAISIKSDKSNFSSQKLSRERNARIENEIHFDSAKTNFFPVFQLFQTYKLSKKDSKAIDMFQNRFKEMFSKFESEIDKVVTITKDMEYECMGTITHEELLKRLEERERNPEKYKERPKGSFEKLADCWGKLMNPNYQIRDEWHDLCINTDFSLKEIATKLKKSYFWSDSCHCEKCKTVKNMTANEEKRLIERTMDRLYASGKIPKL